MKTRFLCVILFLFTVMFCSSVWAGGWVRLEIKGERVNLRSAPDTAAAVKIHAQANTGDTFIAEEWTVLNEEKESRWYKIVFYVDNESGKIVDLSKFNTNIEKGSLVFVNDQLANVLPLKQGEEAQLIKLPYGKTYDPGLGANLPALVRSFGEGKIERSFSPDDYEDFEIILYTMVDLPGLEAVIAESSEGEENIFSFHYITLTKAGVAIDEFDNDQHITVGKSNKKEVEAIFIDWANDFRTITKRTDENGNEEFSIFFEMNGVDVTFGSDGLVNKYHRWVSIH